MKQYDISISREQMAGLLRVNLQQLLDLTTKRRTCVDSTFRCRPKARDFLERV